MQNPLKGNKRTVIVLSLEAILVLIVIIGLLIIFKVIPIPSRNILPVSNTSTISIPKNSILTDVSLKNPAIISAVGAITIKGTVKQVTPHSDALAIDLQEVDVPLYINATTSVAVFPRSSNSQLQVLPASKVQAGDTVILNLQYDFIKNKWVTMPYTAPVTNIPVTPIPKK